MLKCHNIHFINSKNYITFENNTIEPFRKRSNTTFIFLYKHWTYLQSKLNCEVLDADLGFEVRWAVAGESIVVQLLARLGETFFLLLYLKSYFQIKNLNFSFNIESPLILERFYTEKFSFNLFSKSVVHKVVPYLQKYIFLNLHASNLI